MKKTFNELAILALIKYEEENGRHLEKDDHIVVWHWFDEYTTGEEMVRISESNHSPEGIECTVEDLTYIEDWWESEWDQVY